MSPRNLDVLKWVGAIAMVVDHFWLHVLGATYYSEAVGSLAFPLFALALGEGCRSQNAASRDRTMLRLLIGAAVAQAALLLVRDVLPVNVILTLALGVALDTAWRKRDASTVAVALVAALVLGLLVEYQHVGVLFVFAVMRWSATRSDAWLCAVVALLASLFPFNGNHYALLAPLVVVVVSLFPRDAPRARNAFYFVYTLQWPLIAAVRAWL